MKKKLKKYVKYLFSFAFAAILLYFSFRKVEWNTFVDGLKTCNWEFVGLSMCCAITAFIVRSARWRKLLLPLDPDIKLRHTYNAVTIGNMSNMLFPWIGEFIKCGIVCGHSAPLRSLSDSDSVAISSRKRASYDKIIGTIALERVWDLMSVCLIMALLLFFQWDVFGDFFMSKIAQPFSQRLNTGAQIIIIALLLLAVAGVVLLFLLRNKIGFVRKMVELIKGLLQGFGSCLKMEHKWVFAIQTLIIWTMYWLMVVFILQAIPDLSHLRLEDALFISMVGSIASVVPVPGGFGAYHYLVATVISTLYGHPWAIGILFATLAHESQAITMIIAGMTSYVNESVSNSKK